MTTTLPIVVLGLPEDRDMLREAIDGGLDDYLLKPVDLEQLSELISRHVES